MATPTQIRKFIEHRQGLIESYGAVWHGRGVLQEMVRIRVDRFPDRLSILGETLQLTDQGWEPVKSISQPLSEADWRQIQEWVLNSEFWSLPERDQAAPMLDGDSWEIQGYRDGTYHEVRRHTGSVLDGTGRDVYALGQRLATLAGVGRF